MNKLAIMRQMQLEIEEHLAEIETVVNRYGLPLSGITLIARDPNNDKMIVVLTNEDQTGLERSCALAIAQQVINHKEQP